MRIFFLWSLSVKPNLDNDITPSKPRVPWHLVSLPEFSNDWRMEGTARWLRLVLVEITYTLLVMFPSSGGKPLDNHDGMITHVCRARLLDCKEVKWALGSITTNKANGDDGIPAELFQILKDDAVKVLHSIQFSSFTRSCPTLQPHGLQHARPPCPSQTPWAYSNSCPLSQWCHPTISSSVVPFSSRPQSFPATGSFPLSQFASGGQGIGASASTSAAHNMQQIWKTQPWP